MYIILLGLSIFFGIHLVPGLVGLRRRIITSLGERPYQVLYSIISLIGLILIVYGRSKAEFQPIWEPPVWSTDVAVVLMLPSFIFLASANMKSNIKRFTRHPMLWGVVLWSGAHLLANGDLASLLLFGSFGAFSLFGMFSANMRGATKQETKYPFTRDAVTIVAGLVAYGVFIFFHPYFFGASVI
ncbi:MAG: NnrU family protein [Proteobacteria bacterium]|nr:NnrU family protein [Pseudomonadota bacterium]